MNTPPAAKLYKIMGVHPTEMFINTHGALLVANVSEGKKWTPRSYKFVCKIFEDNKIIDVQYIQEKNDKASVQVNVLYQDRPRCLVDLLVENGHAVHHIESKSELNIDSDNNDLESIPESISNESISKLLMDSVEATPIEVPTQDRIIEHKPSNPASNFSSSRSTSSMTQSYLLDLERLVKCWFVTKKKDGEKYFYQYKKHIQPIVSYQNDKHIAPFIKMAMMDRSKTLLNVQAYMIPAILRGINVLGVAPKERGKSMGILIPVLQLVATKNLTRRTEFLPLAVIVCSSWEKVKVMADSARKLLKFLSENDRTRRPKVVSCFAGAKERNIMMTILDGCEILIITPRCLLRLLKSFEMFNLKCMEILCLDDIEILIGCHLDHLREIMLYKQTAAIDRGVEPQRIITTTNWTAGVESFIKNEIGDVFSIIVNDPLEISVFERLNQKMVYCDDITDTFKQVSSYLSLTEAALKRTVIFTTNDKHLNSLYCYLMQNTDYDLKSMKGSMNGQDLKTIQEEWKQYRGLVKMPILLISDEVLGRNEVSITEAQTLFHFDMDKPSFALRLNCLYDKFKELTFLTNDGSKTSEQRACHSYLFMWPDSISPSNSNFLYKFLGRCNVTRPDWLQEKAIDYVLKKEQSKGGNDICPRIKSYGECKLPACDRRHLVRPDIDHPTLPNKGKIKFRILHMDSPSHFYIRILEHKTLDDSDSNYSPLYMDVKMKMLSYFNHQHNIHGVNPRCIKGGLVAAIRIQDLVERVMVIEDSRLRKKKPGCVYVRLIDSGEVRQVEQNDLLQLSSELMEILPQAIEIYIVGIRPLDCDESYPEEALAYTKEFLEGDDLHAVVILCIGSTLWIDSVCQLMKLTMTKIAAWNKNLSVELVRKEFAERNPSHMQKLIRLCTGKVDIWKPMLHGENMCDVPVMKKFTYDSKPMVFEELEIRGDEDYSTVECVFSSVFGPQLLILNCQAHLSELQSLQAELTEMVPFIEAASISKAGPGSLVLYQREGDWLRGCVLQCISNQQTAAIVSVFSLDYGFIERNVPVAELKCLPTEYQELPFQAVFCELHFLQQLIDSYAGDVKDIIVNFGTDYRQKKMALKVICHRQSQLCSTLEPDLCQQILPGTTLHSVEVCKAVGPLSPDLALHEVLIRSQSVLPTAAWIREVLPESAKPVSAMNRRGSAAHITADILATRSLDTRLRLSRTLSRIVQLKMEHFSDTGAVSPVVDELLNCLVILLHFVNQRRLFMHYMRSLLAIARLTQTATLELLCPANKNSPLKLFNIEYVVEIVVSYHSAVHHILRLFNSVLHSSQSCVAEEDEDDDDEVSVAAVGDCEAPDPVCVFIELLKWLLLDRRLIEDLFADDLWCTVLAASIRWLHTRDMSRMFEMLMDVVVQLVMLRDAARDGPTVLEFAGILQQTVAAVAEAGQPVDVRVWACSVSLLSVLVSRKQYWPLTRELRVFGVVADKLLQLSQSGVPGFGAAEFDEAVELLSRLWQCGLVTAHDGQLADQFRDLMEKQQRQRGGSSNTLLLAKLVADMRITESATRKPNGEGVPSSMAINPEEDAVLWSAGKDQETERRRNMAYKRVFEASSDEDDEEPKEDNSVIVSSDDSDVEDDDLAAVAPATAGFLGQFNPADEDNVHCFDRA